MCTTCGRCVPHSQERKILFKKKWYPSPRTVNNKTITIEKKWGSNSTTIFSRSNDTIETKKKGFNLRSDFIRSRTSSTQYQQRALLLFSFWHKTPLPFSLFFILLTILYLSTRVEQLLDGDYSKWVDRERKGRDPNSPHYRLLPVSWNDLLQSFRFSPPPPSITINNNRR